MAAELAPAAVSEPRWRRKPSPRWRNSWTSEVASPRAQPWNKDVIFLVQHDEEMASLTLVALVPSAESMWCVFVRSPLGLSCLWRVLYRWQRPRHRDRVRGSFSVRVGSGWSTVYGVLRHNQSTWKSQAPSSRLHPGCSSHRHQSTRNNHVTALPHSTRSQMSACHHCLSVKFAVSSSTLLEFQSGAREEPMATETFDRPVAATGKPTWLFQIGSFWAATCPRSTAESLVVTEHAGGDGQSAGIVPCS